MTQEKPAPFDSTPFFDSHTADYASLPYVLCSDLLDREVDLIKFIKKNPTHTTFLDVGAGTGRVASLVKQNFPDMHVTALEPSVALLNMLENQSIRKVVGKIPDLNLDPNESFSLIYISHVLHHLVVDTIRKSHNIWKESLLLLRYYLDETGFLIIQDELCETHIIPNATRTLAFFLLTQPAN